MSSAWNIPADVLTVGRDSGLSPRATGGNIDYMEKRISPAGGNGGTYVCRLTAAGDSGSPDSLKDRADILIVPIGREDEEDMAAGLRIRCTSAARAIKLMERIEHAYGNETQDAEYPQDVRAHS